MNGQGGRRNRTQAGFTKIELLVVIAVLAGLAVLIWAGIQHGRDKRKQAQCQANLRQIGLALRAYAEDNRGLLPDCTADNPQFRGAVWPWDMNTNLVAELESRGATRKYLYCPFNAGMNDERHWNYATLTHSRIRILGYVFLLPGCQEVPLELWRRDLNGGDGRKPGELELVTDVTVNQRGDYTHIRGFSLDRTSHLRRGQPAGGNILYEDGHVAWRPFDQMRHRIVGGAIWDF